MVSSSQSTLKIAGAHDFLVDRTLSLFVCVFSSSSHTRLQTDITVEFTPAEGCTQYELSWKEYPAPWGAATGSTMVTAATGSTKTQVAAEGLEPGTTYCVRLTAVDPHSGAKGTPGKELVLDTEQVGCTPTDRKSCCVIL